VSPGKRGGPHPEAASNLVGHHNHRAQGTPARPERCDIPACPRCAVSSVFLAQDRLAEHDQAVVVAFPEPAVRR
jgi:hypothetical protein